MGEGRENRKGNLEKNQKKKDEIRNRSTSSWFSCVSWRLAHLHPSVLAATASSSVAPRSDLGEPDADVDTVAAAAVLYPRSPCSIESECPRESWPIQS
jgi:hypothetical protein